MLCGLLEVKQAGILVTTRNLVRGIREQFELKEETRIRAGKALRSDVDHGTGNDDEDSLDLGTRRSDETHRFVDG